MAAAASGPRARAAGTTAGAPPRGAGVWPRRPREAAVGASAAAASAVPAVPSRPERASATGAADVRNLAIVAHVDHGKTTLVDAMLAQSHAMRKVEPGNTRVMDSGALERERGITILAKNTALTWRGVKVNVIDTPGHADFGGEVERVLGMADGVLLLVDAVEGPMPQTRIVLSRALEAGVEVVVVVNKVDRPGADPGGAANAVLDLFLDLGADDDACDFSLVYASGIQGRAGPDPRHLGDDLSFLFDQILETVPRAPGDPSLPLQLSVAALDHDDHLGRLAIGRVVRGEVKKGASLVVCRPAVPEPRAGAGGRRVGEEDAADPGAADPDAADPGAADADATNPDAADPPPPSFHASPPRRCTAVFTYRDFSRVAVESVPAGDIAVVAGLPDASLGDTICLAGSPDPLPGIRVEDPTVRMTMRVNGSPFAGREGEHVTSSALAARLERELRTDLALRVERESADSFELAGRGALHLGILMETMRREGFEFCVGPPKVILRDNPDDPSSPLQPIEEAWIEVPEEYVGSTTSLMGGRKAEMLDLAPARAASPAAASVASAAGAPLASSDPASPPPPVGTTMRLTYRLPTSSMMGLRAALLTATRGTANLSSAVAEWKPLAAGEARRGAGQAGGATAPGGSMVALAAGQATAYALESAQQRGRLYVRPGDAIYEGMVVGANARPGDLAINVCRKKHLTNMRAASRDQTVVLNEPTDLTLDLALEIVRDDELVEITPESVRLRKNPSAAKRRG